MGLSLAGATLGAGIISGIASAYGANKAGKDAEAATNRQIAWERERAQNAHQWEVNDLKAAGLNPILSANTSGATTGGISAPIPDRSGYTRAGTALIEGITSAFGAAKTNAEIGKTGAETNNITQDTKNKLTAQELMQKQIINESLKSGLISAQTANTEFQNLTKKYEGERAALTYWNNFINTASNSAKNATDLIYKFVPTKHLKEAKQAFGQGFSNTKYIYD